MFTYEKMKNERLIELTLRSFLKKCAYDMKTQLLRKNTIYDRRLQKFCTPEIQRPHSRKC